MMNLFRSCQSFLNQRLKSDRINVSHNILLPNRNPDQKRDSSDSIAVAPQELALANLNPLNRRHKQAPASAQHHGSETKLPHKESLTPRVLATIGWLAGLTAILAGCSSNSVSSDSQNSSSVSAFSPKDINNYATAVLAIELKRRTAYKEIQDKINDEKISEITCNKQDTIKDIDQSIQGIVVNYCKQAKQLVQDKSLTISKFNEITAKAESNPALKTQIQDELLRLQQ